MADYELDANVSMNAGPSEEEWYRIGVAAQLRLEALKQSAIVIPEELADLVKVRRAADEGIVRVVRGASPKAHATHH